MDAIIDSTLTIVGLSYNLVNLILLECIWTMNWLTFQCYLVCSLTMGTLGIFKSFPIFVHVLLTPAPIQRHVSFPKIIHLNRVINIETRLRRWHQLPMALQIAGTVLLVLRDPSLPLLHPTSWAPFIGSSDSRSTQIPIWPTVRLLCLLNFQCRRVGAATLGISRQVQLMVRHTLFLRILQIGIFRD